MYKMHIQNSAFSSILSRELFVLTKLDLTLQVMWVIEKKGGELPTFHGIMQTWCLPTLAHQRLKPFSGNVFFNMVHHSSCPEVCQPSLRVVLSLEDNRDGEFTEYVLTILSVKFCNKSID